MYKVAVSNALMEHQSTDMVCPWAQYYEGKYKKTYVVYMAPDYGIYMVYYDHQQGLWSTPVKVATSPEADPHSAPAILIRNDGKILVFYGCHTGFRYKISTNPEDISSWGAQKNPDFPYATYPHPIQMLNGDIWIFVLHVDEYDATKEGYRISTNGGETFGARVLIVDWAGGPGYATPVYVPAVVRGSDDSIHVTFGIYGAPPNYYRDVFYMWRDPTDGKWKKRDGTVIPLPAHEGTVDKVFDSGVMSEANQCRAWDICLDSDNRPYILFRYNNQYRLAKYENGWKTFTIASGGIDSKWDIGRLRITKTKIYAYLERFGVAGGGTPLCPNRGGDIEAWVSSDWGETWTKERDVAKGSSTPTYGSNLIDLGLVKDAPVGSDVLVIWHTGKEPCDLCYCGEPKPELVEVVSPRTVAVVAVLIVVLVVVAVAYWKRREITAFFRRVI